MRVQEDTCENRRVHEGTGGKMSEHKGAEGYVTMNCA